MARTPLNNKNMFQTVEFELMSVNHSVRSGGIIRISFRLYFSMKVSCVFS